MSMVENYVTKSLTMLGDRTAAFYEKNKAHIFTGLGIGGTILTGVLAAQSGAKSARKIDKKEKELGRKLSFIEKGKLCWKEAIPPVAACGMACFSEYKSDRISSKIIADRTMALVASEKAYEKLSQKTKEVLGEKKAKQVKDDIVNDKIEQAINNGVLSLDDFNRAPRVGNGELYRFVDEHTMLPFWSNADYIARMVMEMNNIMSELKERGGDTDYYDKKVGVPYREWLHRIGYLNHPNITDTPERRDAGWNKGFKADGTDDDEIAYTLVPKEWQPGIAVTAVVWEKKPTDMRLGRLIKSSGVL